MNDKSYSVTIDKKLYFCDVVGCDGLFNSEKPCNYRINGTKATCREYTWFRISQSLRGQPGPIVSKFQLSKRNI